MLDLESILEKELPAIWDKLKAKGIDIVSDEDNIRLMMEKAYEMLPTPVRLVVKRDTFINFALEHKDKILPEKPKPTKKKITATATSKTTTAAKKETAKPAATKTRKKTD
ncbi:hypothetical protein SAMN05421780_11130 [Flexibacter flexilis DSM 6793]|uniref:Uncharacterized protein n=1 Tax=Flexibacter flexilis DSM 6793 TaxID=927664 RepID=A0A1I1MP91_9BACT|nr:hypothetical protein [Flexibacter flexilis]SFC87199.1 hypothetical protein SAMN05421780_11130 [Flexibacter flexilis DSM 6793]